jgi:hypothetical protein
MINLNKLESTVLADLQEHYAENNYGCSWRELNTDQKLYFDEKMKGKTARALFKLWCEWQGFGDYAFNILYTIDQLRMAEES